ncbi:MAG: DUF2793 domain-containing protein [Chloracidobacterium sp.]|nr:DUF2793 domain-containing protein [Chloracidobacterium sp.]
MASSTEPRSGLKYGWSLGESGWNAEMDANLTGIGRFAYHLSIKDRDLTAPPGSPASGDTYIPAATATGAWAGKENQIAVWDGAAWVFGVPREGWVASVDDEDVMIRHNGTSWSTSQGEVQALRDKCEELADDVRALSVLLHRIRTDLITFGVIKGAA